MVARALQHPERRARLPTVRHREPPLRLRPPTLARPQGALLRSTGGRTARCGGSRYPAARSAATPTFLEEAYRALCPSTCPAGGREL